MWHKTDQKTKSLILGSLDNLLQKQHIVDPHFSRASPLDRRDSFFICEKLIFGKKLESPFILFLF